MLRSSLIRNQSIMSMRGFLRAIAYACFMYSACFDHVVPKIVRSGGFVW